MVQLKPKNLMIFNAMANGASMLKSISRDSHLLMLTDLREGRYVGMVEVFIACIIEAVALLLIARYRSCCSVKSRRWDPRSVWQGL